MATVMGVVMIVLGVCILASPVAAGIVGVIMVGVFMVIAGIAQLARGLRETEVMARLTWILLGIVTLVGGALVAAHPIFGLGFLTLLLAVYFFMDGIVKVVAAFKCAVGRAWFVANGILSFILAYLIWTNWPLSGGWAIGVLVGINFIFTGVMTLALGRTAA